MDPLPLNLADYTFELPESLIATAPPAARDGARMLVLGAAEPHQQIVDLPDRLNPGDLLVVNDTRVLRCRLHLERASGGQVEVLLLRADAEVVPALVRPAKKLKIGERLGLPGAGPDDTRGVIIEGRAGDGTLLVRPLPDPASLMAERGELPLPPYLHRDAGPEDDERYQTVFAAHDGAVAAPTAGLHLSDALLARLAERGVGLARITLHVGQGTFQPLREDDLARGALHAERYEISAETAAAVAACRARGGRVIAVGTTSLRALESAAEPDGRLRVGPGETTLFVREGYRPRVISGLLTNFHLPQTSLLMLVCALGGRERVLGAYQEAIRHGYRFYSYGDAMLLL